MVAAMSGPNGKPTDMKLFEAVERVKKTADNESRVVDVDTLAEALSVQPPFKPY